MEPLVSFKQVTSSVRLGNGEQLKTVDNVSFDLYRGSSYAVVGKSGSGKTSLISIVGLLNRLYEGQYNYDTIDVSQFNDKQCSHFRAKNIGFVFQNYSLIKHLNVKENIELALRYSNAKLSSEKITEKIHEVLKTVGLEKREREFPSHLSGGEQQRVAIARALIKSPELLICDEPTGALDYDTGRAVMNTLDELIHSRKLTLLLVTHDADIASMCDTVFHMQQGRLDCV